MAAPGRKKSIASSQGLPPLQIDQPVAAPTILNKQASTSLYQQCVTLKNKLLKIHDFAPYFSLVDSPEKDTVQTLWDCLALGTPLCFLFNLLDLPVTERIQVSTDPDEIDPDPENIRDKKRAAAFFIMGIQRLKNNGQWHETTDLFTVTELINLRGKDTNGFVKVVATVAHLVDQLPPHVWKEHPDSPQSTGGRESGTQNSYGQSSPSQPKPSAQEVSRDYILKELIDSERKYVQDLEVMQNYSRALHQQNVVDQDTIHHLFPGLNKLLDFQRKFLIELEQQTELPWEQQRWGRCFIANEQNFDVYEPYCANFTNASELALAEEPHLMALAHIINPKGELPAFLIKPIQRVCKYPLLMADLIKRCEGHEYYQEYLEGTATTKRIADRLNEAQRRSENAATVKILEQRVEDWKGHALANFGELLLDDVFTVTKSDVDREYHVFLFEKIILCCKDATIPTPNKKVSKSNSILKKTPSVQATPPPFGDPSAAAKKKTTPLLLKGRIFLNNVTSAMPAPKGQYALQVWWRGDEDLEYFTLRCRSEDQMQLWEKAVNKLLNDAEARRMERRQNRADDAYHERNQSISSPLNGAPPKRGRLGSHPDERPPLPQGPYPGQVTSQYGSYPTPGGPNDWNAGFETEEEGYESSQGSSYQHSSINSHYATTESGRSTPNTINGRRANAAISMPPEAVSGPNQMAYRDPRRTEDSQMLSQWRAQHQSNGSIPMPPQGSALPQRPLMSSRNASAASAMSNASGVSDASFGNGVARGPTLRTMQSASRLRSQTYGDDNGPIPPGGDRASAYARYEQQNGNGGGTRTPPTNPNLGQPLSRNRSISNPAAYPGGGVPQPAPPMPKWNGANGPGSASRIGAGGSREMLSQARGVPQGYPPAKRPISGGSSDTGDSSEYSPDGNALAGNNFGGANGHHPNPGLRGTRSQVFHPGHSNHHSSGGGGYNQAQQGPPIKIKVYWGEDLFMIIVPRSTTYDHLVERVQRKIRLCGGNVDANIKLKYDDDEGDRVSLSTDEELQMAFDMISGKSVGQGQLTLRVQ